MAPTKTLRERTRKTFNAMSVPPFRQSQELFDEFIEAAIAIGLMQWQAIETMSDELKDGRDPDELAFWKHQAIYHRAYALMLGSGSPHTNGNVEPWERQAEEQLEELRRRKNAERDAGR